jgi:hypothetical protein
MAKCKNKLKISSGADGKTVGNPKITPSGRKVTRAEKKKKKNH